MAAQHPEPSSGTPRSAQHGISRSVPHGTSRSPSPGAGPRPAAHTSPDTFLPSSGDLRTTAHPAREALLAGWNDLLDRTAPGGPDPAPFGERLLAAWAEPQRRYHTTDHLAAVLNRVDELSGHAADADTVRLAAWFHDAVYQPERSANEERSALLAEHALAGAGVPAERAAEVVRLVLITVTHDPEDGDLDGEVLCDADLAVLAGAPAAYAAYAAAVREEYGFVPDDVFRAGRSDVLRRLLALPRLYRTPVGRDRWEDRARRNLTTELELLSA